MYKNTEIREIGYIGVIQFYREIFIDDRHYSLFSIQKGYIGGLSAFLSIQNIVAWPILLFKTIKK